LCREMLNSNISRRQFDLIEVETKSWNRCFQLSDDSPCLFVCLLQTHGQTRENTKIPVFSKLFSRAVAHLRARALARQPKTSL
jgi:hypothetical protein